MLDLENVRAQFAADRYAAHSGIVIEQADEGYARCVMAIQPYHLNALDSVQGGAIFTLGDFAFAVASCCGKQKAVSLANQISYMKPAKGKQLIAEAKVISSGRRACFYDVRITDELGTPVATMTVNGFVVENG